MFFILGFSQTNPNDSIRTDYKPNDSIPALSTSKSDVEVYSDILAANSKAIKPKFNPTKAGLYSAVLPGLGQFYNKKYWKIPIVFGAIGTGLGVTFYNDKQYKKYRGYFIDKLNGTPNEFVDANPQLTKEVFGNAQDQAKRQRDYAIAITGLVYILNIVDAVVDAHLYEGRHDPDLAVSPTIINDGVGLQNGKAGIALNFKF